MLKRFRYFGKKLGILLLCYPLSAYALSFKSDELPLSHKDEREFLALVNQTGGYITQSFHQQFWEIMKAKYDEQQRDKIVRELQYSIDVLREFQTKTWESARESYFLKRKEKVKEYDELKNKMLLLQSQYYSPQFIIDNAEKIISASASRTALDLGNGKFYITPEFIQENMTGIHGGYERLRLLMTPVWQEDYKEYVLPNLNVSLLSLYSPDEYHENITNRNEKIDIHIAQLNVNADSAYEIGSVDYQREEQKFVDFTPEEQEIYIQEFVKRQLASYGIVDPSLSKGEWRGYKFAKSITTFDNRNIIIMSLIVKGKAFYIKYISGANLTTACADFNDFTKRVQILDF